MDSIDKKNLMNGLSDSQVSESKSKYATNELSKKVAESLW